MQRCPVLRVVYDPGERHERHAHSYSNVSVVIAGSLMERVGRTEVEVGPLSVVVKPAGTEHANAFGPQGAVMLQLPVTPQWSRADGTQAVDRWRWHRSPEAARWMLRLATAAAETDRWYSVDDGIAECLGAVGGLGDRNSNDSIPDWLDRVRERIRDERGRGASVSQLARDAGVHPVYLTRRFRRAFGCSVVASLQVERVRAAADALASGSETISGVAYGTGFADQPHLTRTFRRVTGVTPGAYRRLARGQEVGNVQEPSPERR